MAKSRVAYAIAFVAVVAFCWVDYSNYSDEWFKEKVTLRIGVPGSPWFDYYWFSNPIEGGGYTKVRAFSYSSLMLVLGVASWRCGRWFRNEERK